MNNKPLPEPENEELPELRFQIECKLPLDSDLIHLIHERIGPAPEILFLFDTDRLYCLCRYCEQEGFESPQAQSRCKQLGVSCQEVKLLTQWLLDLNDILWDICWANRKLNNIIWANTAVAPSSFVPQAYFAQRPPLSVLFVVAALVMVSSVFPSSTPSQRLLCSWLPTWPIMTNMGSKRDIRSTDFSPLDEKYC